MSSTVVAGAKLPVFWGSATLQGLDVGIFISLALAVVFGLLINRTRLGYEARTVGFNPEAARYAGINAGRTWIRVMLISGAFAGVAAALDMLGWKFSLFTNDIQTSQIGFFGIAVALLGRNTAGGTVAAAVLFGALLTGTSDRNINLSIDPTLVQYLTFMIEGIIILLVSTDLITLRLLKGGRRIGVALRRRPSERREEGGVVSVGTIAVNRQRRRVAEAGRHRGRGSGRARLGDHDPADRGPRRSCRRSCSRSWRSAPAPGRSPAASASSGSAAIAVAVLAVGGAVGVGELVGRDARVGVHLVGAGRGDAPLRDAAAVRGARRAWSPSAAASSTSGSRG